MATSPEARLSGTPYRTEVRPPTTLMREILDMSREFEVYVGRELTVNSTDLAAMELILMKGIMGPSEIAKRLGLSTAAVTTVVDRLVALGHVTREKNPVDRRAVAVTPTAESTARAMAVIMPVVQAIESTLDGFDDEEQAIVTRYLEQVAAAYRSELPVSAGI